MSRNSIIHEVFKIEIEDGFGYIAGLPMGKKDEITDIKWDQFNAGLSHLCLALNFLSIKYNHTFSKIQDIKLQAEMTEILLQGKTGYLPVGYTDRDHEKTFGEMLEVLLIEEVRLSEVVRRNQSLEYTEDLKLPFEIDEKEHKIRQFFINPCRYDEKCKWRNWTKAIKCFLINFKYILTISSLGDPYI